MAGENKFDNNMRGAIFNNDKKSADTHPDMTGKVEIDGKEYLVSAWWKKSQKVKGEFLTFNLREPKSKANSGKSLQQINTERVQGRRNQTQEENFDDDIPF